jgi:hypothetical protein
MTNLQQKYPFFNLDGFNTEKDEYELLLACKEISGKSIKEIKDFFYINNYQNYFYLTFPKFCITLQIDSYIYGIVRMRNFDNYCIIFDKNTDSLHQAAKIIKRHCTRYFKEFSNTKCEFTEVYFVESEKEPKEAEDVVKAPYSGNSYDNSLFEFRKKLHQKQFNVYRCVKRYYFNGLNVKIDFSFTKYF